jgi:hypothetical protein
MEYFDLYVQFILIIKIIFILLALYGIYVKYQEPKNTEKQEKIHYTKERIELLFKGSMAILLILLFNPRTTKDVIKLDYETKLLLFSFGWVLLITANWKSIITNIPKSIIMFQEIFGMNHTSIMNA